MNLRGTAPARTRHAPEPRVPFRYYSTRRCHEPSLPSRPPARARGAGGSDRRPRLREKEEDGRRRRPRLEFHLAGRRRAGAARRVVRRRGPARRQRPGLDPGAPEPPVQAEQLLPLPARDGEPPVPEAAGTGRAQRRSVPDPPRPRRRPDRPAPARLHSLRGVAAGDGLGVAGRGPGPVPDAPRGARRGPPVGPVHQTRSVQGSPVRGGRRPVPRLAGAAGPRGTPAQGPRRHRREVRTAVSGREQRQGNAGRGPSGGGRGRDARKRQDRRGDDPRRGPSGQPPRQDRVREAVPEVRDRAGRDRGPRGAAGRDRRDEPVGHQRQFGPTR